MGQPFGPLPGTAHVDPAQGLFLGDTKEGRRAEAAGSRARGRAAEHLEKGARESAEGASSWGTRVTNNQMRPCSQTDRTPGIPTCNLAKQLSREHSPRLRLGRDYLTGKGFRIHVDGLESAIRESPTVLTFDEFVVIDPIRYEARPALRAADLLHRRGCRGPSAA